MLRDIRCYPITEQQYSSSGTSCLDIEPHCSAQTSGSLVKGPLFYENANTGVNNSFVRDFVNASW